MTPALSKEVPPTSVPTHVLDFMRGFAAVYVVVNHVRGSFFKGGNRTISEAVDPLGLYDYVSLALLQFTSLGTEFVILFFCVSGFAMAHSTMHSPSAIQFYMRRVIRIWPPYLVAIGLAALVCILSGSLDPSSRITQKCTEHLCTAEGLFLMATYIEVQSPVTAQFWSLPYEVIFYAFCPFLLWHRSAIPAVFTASLLLLLIGVAIWGMDLNPSSSVMVNFFINALAWFMSGVLAYHYLGRVPKLSVLGFMLAVVGLLAAILVVKSLYGGPNAISNVLMIAFSVLCIRNLPHRWTSNPRWNWGYFSYSIYIFHMAFIILIKLILEHRFHITASDIESYWAWMLFLPFVLFGTWVMYFLGEKQCNELLRRMTRKRPRATA